MYKIYSYFLTFPVTNSRLNYQHKFHPVFFFPIIIRIKFETLENIVLSLSLYFSSIFVFALYCFGFPSFVPSATLVHLVVIFLLSPFPSKLARTLFSTHCSFFPLYLLFLPLTILVFSFLPSLPSLPLFASFLSFLLLLSLALLI